MLGFDLFGNECLQESLAGAVSQAELRRRLFVGELLIQLTLPVNDVKSDGQQTLEGEA